MGALEDVVGKVAEALLSHGPIGLLAIAGWSCTIVTGTVIMVIWRALRAAEGDKVKILQDQLDAADKERAEMDHKMDILQAVLEAKNR